MIAVPMFHTVDAGTVQDILSAARSDVLALVRQTYLRHHNGESVNPPSVFVRPPSRPGCRIIALPAHLGGGEPMSGLKWIASYPANLERGLPRASAVLLLNDADTGFPIGCLEASQISAARTAASAVVAAEALTVGEPASTVAFIGAGVINRTVADYLAAVDWPIQRCLVHDRVPDYTERFLSYLRDVHGYRAEPATLQDAVAGADLLVFATTAATPHVTGPGTLRPGHLVLDLSLRDIDPDLMVEAHNVLDDVEHCLTADTSPHLTEQRFGHRDFIDGTLAEVLLGTVTLGSERPVIFSPFGLGVLDLAVGGYVYRVAVESGRAGLVPDFFAGTGRWS